MATLLGQLKQYGTPVLRSGVSDAHQIATRFELIEDPSHAGARCTSRQLEVSRTLSVAVRERSQRRNHQVA